jgi:DNA-binding transcriptional LysR family regulator
LVPKLGSFLDAHPKVQLDLVMDDRAVDLVAENIDVALRMGVLTDSALRARKLGQAERLAIASPAYLARRGVPRTPADLLEHDGVIYGQSLGRTGMALSAWHFGDIGVPQDASETECGRRSA